MTATLARSIDNRGRLWIAHSRQLRDANDVLMGDTGSQKLSGLLSGADNSGSVQLTLRADVQQIAAQALGNREGSVVVMDPTDLPLVHAATLMTVQNLRAIGMNVEVQAPVEYAGDLMGDMNGRRGRISGMGTSKAA